MAENTNGTSNTSTDAKPSGFEGLATGLSGDKIHPAARQGIALQSLYANLKSSLGPIGAMKD
jgi:hypothetical protein